MVLTPVFSIIVPVYKVEKYIHQCVDSLLNQDYENYEIILVDDGSPDKCPDFCDDYAAKYSKVKVVHKVNGGLSDARNKGVEVAFGQYVTFVDSDDFWKETNVLSNIADIINEYHPDIIVSDIIKYYADSDKYLYPSITCDSSLNGKSKTGILNYLYYNHADLKMSACQKFVLRALLTNHQFKKGLLSEDIDWSLSLYPHAKNICLYNKPYYCYRQMREGSITNTASQKSFDSLIQIIDKWENAIKQLDISKEEKDIYLGYLAYQLSITMPLSLSLTNESKRDALNQIKQKIGLFNYPLNSKTKKVRLLVKCLGVETASKLLSKYIQRRHKHNL